MLRFIAIIALVLACATVVTPAFATWNDGGITAGDDWEARV